MKIRKLVFLAVSAMVLLVSCATTPHNLGIHNPDKIPEEDLVTLQVFPHIEVVSIDDHKVNWSEKFHRNQTVIIPSGGHTFRVAYNDGSMRSSSPMQVTGNFEKGNTYALLCDIMGYRASLHIFTYNNQKIGDGVTLDMAARGNGLSVIAGYVKYILNPQQETGNTVKLENDKYLLIYEPDLIYSLTDKKTGAISTGKAGFEVDLRMTIGKVYLFETDISAISTDQFLNSDYKENAQTVLFPVECSAAEVTYIYEKPVELKGNRITFSITEIQGQ
jgi:hypothetical protein